MSAHGSYLDPRLPWVRRGWLLGAAEGMHDALQLEFAAIRNDLPPDLPPEGCTDRALWELGRVLGYDWDWRTFTR